MLNIKPEIEKYILEHTTPESKVLYDLYRQTHLKMVYPRMLSGHLQGRTLYMLCRMINPQNVLETGTFTGYSAICMAEALPEGGKITTIEINDELESFIRQHLQKANVENKVNLLFGDAREIIPTLTTKFDLVFIDGEKCQYPDYYQAVFDKVKPGGFIIADNALWDGKVTESSSPADSATKGIVEFNRMVSRDNRVENVILPLRDGLMVIRKI